MWVRRKAFAIGRAIGKRPMASRLFCLVEPALPLQRLARSGQVVAFRHPRPSYDPHILVVPTTPFPALEALSFSVPGKSVLVWEMAALARLLTHTSQVQWQMIINGGQRQDIGQVHGHVIHGGDELSGPAWDLDNPESNPDGWNQLFDRVHRASQVPSNGYSVTLHFASGDRLTAAFSESVRS
jgi:diadenosine tetraphosphate (Ap4A) HIT family hydrolase